MGLRPPCGTEMSPWRARASPWGAGSSPSVGKALPCRGQSIPLGHQEHPRGMKNPIEGSEHSGRGAGMHPLHVPGAPVGTWSIPLGCQEHPGGLETPWGAGASPRVTGTLWAGAGQGGMQQPGHCPGIWRGLWGVTENPCLERNSQGGHGSQGVTCRVAPEWGTGSTGSTGSDVTIPISPSLQRDGPM